MVGPLEALARLRKVYGDQGLWWPVDTAYHKAHDTDPRFEVCVGAILTQNTAWANVERALENLKAKGLLDPKRLIRAEEKDVQEAIRPAGFFQQKTNYVRTFARYVAKLPEGLDDLFKGKPQRVRELLLSFTGVGPETADSILVYAAGIPSFVVDAYTRRLTKRLGLGTGEETYEMLQHVWSKGLLPQAPKFGQAHALIVEHCKARCTARLPRCPGCALESVCQQVGVEPDVYKRLP